ncbi:MAG: Asp-tRNA(Asn)/Glu-tRNA(Gln) amidotransferase GatCAB subunit A [Candidatus Omnitrophica bacterium CG11_big_fil_rev_8_21_14_0_20_63_9]|nr:MAG: Asp-tRNA(Asn)/Glu-tRNA(Gln) amidotransferase GatCAB subunit A [Candidatus Omnitrophica bacterium CG11_big_fil_rev_8_21_14_0_20_63_9]
MPTGELAAQTLHELRDLIQAGRISADEVVADVLACIERSNPSMRAYLAVDAERIRRQAAQDGPLAGLPITIKDNICVSGEETTCASRILQGFRAPYDATVIARLRQQGARLIPRANMDEFAFGSSTENSAFGPTRNPWAMDRVPGGSSGGSAAAVAAGLAIAALGSDTGGSIRQPASFCGVVGLKPTYGRVSRYGLVAFASSLDQIGPLTKDVTDAALVLSAIAGHDTRDSTSAPLPVPDYLAALRGKVDGLRVGIPKEYLIEGIDPDVRQAIDAAIKACERLGMRTEPVSLPHTSYAVATYYIIATAEASSNLARYDGVKYGFRASTNGEGGLLEMYLRTRTDGFGAEPKRRILLGTYVLSHGYYDAYYLKGLKVRTLIKQDFDRAFERCDLLLTPTAPSPAFRIGEKLDDPLQMYLSDIFTISANLAGVPALSMPCGFTGAGLPVGLQLLAPPFKEDVLLRAAFAYEQATEWHRRKPAMTTG